MKPYDLLIPHSGEEVINLLEFNTHLITQSRDEVIYISKYKISDMIRYELDYWSDDAGWDHIITELLSRSHQ